MTRVSVKSMNQLIKEKLCSKQETVCQIAGLKLFDCSNAIDKININGYKAINANGKVTSSDKLSVFTAFKMLDMSFYGMDNVSMRTSLELAKPYIPHFVGTHTQATFPITEEYAKLASINHYNRNFATMLQGDNSILDLYNDFASSNCPKLVRMEYNRALDTTKNQYKEPQ